MFQTERMDKIISILKANGFVTVKYLTKELHYSTATVNRDLNALEQMGEIVRSYGGVELKDQKALPLTFRYEFAKHEKKRLAKRAAELIEDGDTVFMDGSTTVQYMGEYILEKKDLTVLTNNLALSIFLSEYGIRVIVLGGEIVETPYMLSGADSIETASRYKADKFFFSTAGVSSDGEMSYTGDEFFTLHRTMLRNSKKSCFLTDKEKIDNPRAKIILGDFSLVSYVISDHLFDENVHLRFPDTEFIYLE